MSKLIFNSIKISKNKNELILEFFYEGKKIKKIYRLSEKINVNNKTIKNVVFNIGLMNLIDFDQIVIPDEVHINAGKLTKYAKEFYFYVRDNYARQSFFERKMPLSKLTRKIYSKGPKYGIYKGLLNKKQVVCSFGGGKESLLYFYLFKKWNIKGCWFYRDKATNVKIKKSIMDSLDTKDYIRVAERTVGDIQLPPSRTHTGISIFIFLMVLIALHKKYSYICMGNERSANDPYCIWDGKVVNHQFDKAIPYRLKINEYIKKYIAPEINFFSIFEGLYEFKLAQLIPIIDTKSLMLMTSCNKGTDRKKWCCKCPKCAWGFAILSYALGKDKAIKIVGEDIFNDVWLFKEMLDPKIRKPFECLGERTEIWLILSKCIEKKQKGKVLDYFRRHYLDEIRNLLPEYEKKYTKVYPNPTIPDFIKKRIRWNV